MSNQGCWLYHFGGGEEWFCDDEQPTKEAAIVAGREYAQEYADDQGMDDEERSCFLQNGEFEVAEMREFEPCVDVEMVLEKIAEDAYELAGEAAEDYLSEPRFRDTQEQKDKWRKQVMDLQDRLTGTFNAWAMETGNTPKFRYFEDAFTIKIAEEN